MKHTILLFSLALFPALSFAKTVTCHGSYTWNDNQGTEQYWMTALVDSGDQLSNVQEQRVDTDGKSEQFTSEVLHSDEAYKPNNPKYKGFNRFALPGSNGWTSYYLLLPKKLTGSSVVGHEQRVGHDSYPTIDLVCDLN